MRNDDEHRTRHQRRTWLGASFYAPAPEGVPPQFGNYESAQAPGSHAAMAGSARRAHVMLTAYVVTSNSDAYSGFGLDGTLRYCITQLDSAGTGVSTISFSLGSSQQTISLSSALPAITRPVVIEDGTVPGTTEPLVVINGSSAGQRHRPDARGSGFQHPEPGDQRLQPRRHPHRTRRTTV